MTITLQAFSAGDTNYVGKLNANDEVIAAAIGALQSVLTGAAFSAATLTNAYTALFGAGVALIGSGSYACTDGGGGTLNVAAGICYRPTLSGVFSKPTSTALSFSGQPADTYYIVIDSTGTPTRGTVSLEAIYSVVWSGSAFGTITRLAAIVWGAADWVAGQTSAALAATYPTLDARLEAGETVAAAALLMARAYDVPGSYAGAPTASLVLARYPLPRTVTFPIALAGSQGVAAVAATAQTDFDILKNGVSFGTMRFAAAGTVASFISAAGSVFSAGDVLTVVAPASPDATLANVGFVLAGTR